MEIKKFEFQPEDITVFENSVIRVFIPCQPHTHAQYGGHLVIQTKEFRSLCTEFTPEESKQVSAMVQACTELMLEKLGAVRTNNQDNGNWFFLKSAEEQAKGSPRCHIHIYGRSPAENKYGGPGAQIWGKSLVFPFPDELGYVEGSTWMEYIHPYTKEQIMLIGNELHDRFNHFLFA